MKSEEENNPLSRPISEELAAKWAEQSKAAWDAYFEWLASRPKLKDIDNEPYEYPITTGNGIVDQIKNWNNTLRLNNNINIDEYGFYDPSTILREKAMREQMPRRPYITEIQDEIWSQRQRQAGFKTDWNMEYFKRENGVDFSLSSQQNTKIDKTEGVGYGFKTGYKQCYEKLTYEKLKSFMDSLYVAKPECQTYLEYTGSLGLAIKNIVIELLHEEEYIKYHTVFFKKPRVAYLSLFVKEGPWKVLIKATEINTYHLYYGTEEIEKSTSIVKILYDIKGWRGEKPIKK